VDARVPRERAAALYADLRGQAVRMLTCDLIHGDLSPYNVLLGRAGPVVIDFPQVIGAAHNSQAERFFERDVENLRRFFAALDPALHAAAGDAREIWRAYVRRELGADFVPSGRGAEAPRGGRAGHPRDARAAHPGAPARRDGGAPAPRREERPDRGGPRHGGHRAQPEHGPRREHEPRGRGGPPPPAGRRAGDAPRRDRGPRAPEVIRVVRPPLGDPSSPGAHAPPQAAPKAHAPAAKPHAGAAPRPHAPAAPQRPHVAAPPPHGAKPHAAAAPPAHERPGAPPAGDAPAARRRRRRRRGPRPA
jgi:RIO kinase 1